MILSKGILAAVRSVTAVVSSIILLIVGSDESNLPQPDGATIVSKTTYTLLDKDAMTQGITNDGTHYFFSSKKKLSKGDIKTGKITKMNTDAIPQVLKDKGCNHIGGLSYNPKNNLVYAAIEDGPDYNNSFIALYDPETLEYKGTYYELPHELHIYGVPWCAVDVENNSLYTAEWESTGILNVFDLDTMELKNKLSLSENIAYVQGAEYYNGKLYLSCDERGYEDESLNNAKRIMTIDVKTGVVGVAFSRNIGSVFEAEGMTITVDEEGPLFHVIDIGERRKSVNLTTYRLSK